jgi:restriction endonuclease S subunit
VLFRQEEAEMRRKLIEADLIECVLGLGPNLFYNSPMEACVVICRTDKPKKRRGKILLINAVNEVTRERAQSFLTYEHVDHIVCAYNDFKDETGFARVARLEEIQAKDSNLSIPLYVTSVSSSVSVVQTGKVTHHSDNLPKLLDDWHSSRKSVAVSIHNVFPNISSPIQEKMLKRIESGTLYDRKGWRTLPLGEFARSINERVEPSEAAEDIYVGLEHLDPQDLHIRRWGKGSDVIGTKLRFRKGDIIFGRRRAYQRKLAVAEFDGICSAHAMVVRAKPEVVLPEFLPFLMISDRFMNRAVEISVGSLSPTINWKTLKREEFCLPPLDQQRRIAEILWAFDDSNKKLQAFYDSLKAFYKATLDRGCLENGEMHRLGDIVDYASDGPFGSKLKTEHYTSFGARVIRLQNIGDGKFDDTDKAFISMNYFGELMHHEVRAEDVIVAGLGDEKHLVGRAALIPGNIGPAVNKADCFCLRGASGRVLNAYIAHFLNSKFGTDQVKALAQGTTRLRINVGNLKTILVSLPSLSQQVHLIGKVDEMQQLMTIIAHGLKCNSGTRNAILNKIFEGRS